MTQNEEIAEVLAQAREAHAAATRALAKAEEAARVCGVEVADHEAVSELRVQQIRVVEPDGTTRMIIGGSSLSKIMPSRGEDLAHPGRGDFGGIIFCNDEGTEAGGLVYAGGTIDGQPRQVGFWTVDDFEQNEGLAIGAQQIGQERTKFIAFADQPYWSHVDHRVATEGKTGDELAAAEGQFEDTAAERMRLFRDADGSVGLVLRDGKGVERIRLVVATDGIADITCTGLDGTEKSIFAS